MIAWLLVTSLFPFLRHVNSLNSPLTACIFCSTIDKMPCHTHLCASLWVNSDRKKKRWFVSMRWYEIELIFTFALWLPRADGLRVPSMGMGRRHVEGMHSGSRRVSLMYIKTLVMDWLLRVEYYWVLIIARWFSSCQWGESANLISWCLTSGRSYRLYAF